MESPVNPGRFKLRNDAITMLLALFQHIGFLMLARAQLPRGVIKNLLFWPAIGKNFQPPFDTKGALNNSDLEMRILAQIFGRVG